MAKRKNPLKDLDAFLKQEAKTFVQPDKLAANPIQEEPIASSKKEANTDHQIVNEETVIEFLSNLKNSDNHSFYEVLKLAAEKSGLESSENKMLVNTILYLQNKEDWKEVIKDYWS